MRDTHSMSVSRILFLSHFTSPLMNHTFKALVSKRHSVRTYSPQTIENEKLQYVLDCTRQAPSAVNRQPWKFYLIQSAEAREKIQKCYDREWFRQAPLYILCCTDHTQSWHRPHDHKDHADIDIAIAVEHLCLAAADCGLGTCWVCNFDADLCHTLFQLPDHIEAAVIVPIGYPAEEKPKERTRKSLEEIIEKR